MSRRAVLSIFCLGFGLLILPARADDDENRGPVRRPNIILLLLDDQDAFTPMWDAMPETAAMIRDRGMTFNKSFAPTPICSPGRVTLLSGKLAHNTGVYTLVGPTGGWRYPPNSTQSFAVELDRLGYSNALFGKSWGAYGIAPGWDTWCSLSGETLYEGYNYEVCEQRRGRPANVYPSSVYSTDFLAGRVVDYLRDRGGDDTPFCVWLAPTAPHLPLNPAARHSAYAFRRWKGDLPKNANFNEKNLADKSDWLKSTAATRSAAVPYAQGEYPKRMGSLMAVDEMMARIRNVLEAQGKWDRTVLIVTSDNGYNLGAHRLIHKMAPYEESIRVPLAIAGAGVAHGSTERLVGLHDIAPTLVELAGGIWPTYMDGKSLVPYLRDGDETSIAWRTALVAEYNSGGVRPGYNPGGSMRAGYNLDIPTYRTVRTDTHKYIRFAGGDEELYDLTNDPFELNNLLRSKKPPGPIRMLRDQLRGRLQTGLNCAGPNCE